MRIIAKSTLREFWERHPNAETPLRMWYSRVSRADWDMPSKVTQQYPDTSIIGNERVIFRIKGNDYRLVVVIKYRYRKVYIRFVGTHAEYDRIDARRV